MGQVTSLFFRSINKGITYIGNKFITNTLRISLLGGCCFDNKIQCLADIVILIQNGSILIDDYIFIYGKDMSNGI